MNAVIIDDEQNARIGLSECLKRYCPSVNIIGEADSVSTGIELLKKLSPSIVFLDINLRDGTGFDLLNKIGDHQFWIIFVTAYDEFALKAFEFSAIDYVLKPISPLDLIEAVAKVEKTEQKVIKLKIDNAVNYIETKELKRLILPSSDGLTIVPIEEIIRLEASGGPYTTLFSEGRKPMMLSKTLKEYGAILPESKFFRIHQSHIVSLSKVSKLISSDNSVLLTDGSCVDISRRQKNAFISALSNF